MFSRYRWSREDSSCVQCWFLLLELFLAASLRRKWWLVYRELDERTRTRTPGSDIFKFNEKVLDHGESWILASKTFASSLAVQVQVFLRVDARFRCHHSSKLFKQHANCRRVRLGTQTHFWEKKRKKKNRKWQRWPVGRQKGGNRSG